MSGEILAAARAIRPYLSSLLDDETARRCDESLARLLQESGEDVEAHIVDELARHDATRDWAGAFLEFGVPPDLVRYDERSFQLAPGYGDTVRIPKFACPHGDYTWYRHEVGEDLPHCPTHDAVVEPVDP